MKAVDNAIENFLRRTTDRKRVVVNLGCGYDPLPFRVHFKGLAHEGVKFVDVDYREVILTKVKLMTDDKHLRTFLDSWNYSTTEDGDVVLTSDYYAIVGCAFNDIVCLNHLFSQTIPLQGCKTLLIVEDSFMHMETCEAIAIIKWAAGFENGSCNTQFFLYCFQTPQC
jgi:tRNA wybutosine-synthesizing protein 4